MISPETLAAAVALGIAVVVVAVACWVRRKILPFRSLPEDLAETASPPVPPPSPRPYWDDLRDRLAALEVSGHEDCPRAVALRRRLSMR